MREAADTHIFDPRSSAFLRDPTPTYRRLVHEHPVLWSDVLSSWVIAGPHEAQVVLRDWRSFAADPRRVGQPSPPPSIQFLDPPEHTDLRRAVARALNSQDHERLEAVARTTAAQLVRVISEKEQADLVSDFAVPLSRRMTALLLGIEEHEALAAAQYAEAIRKSMDHRLRPGAAEQGASAKEAVAALVQDWLEHPSNEGVLRALAHDSTGLDLSGDVLAGTVRVMLFSGLEALRHFLGNAVVELSRSGHPLRFDEDVLRKAGPVQAVSRLATTDSRVGGAQVRQGETVTVLLGAVNAAGQTHARHLALGHGIHSCLGAQFVRLVSSCALSELRAGVCQLTLHDSPIPNGVVTVRGYHAIPVTAN